MLQLKDAIDREGRQLIDRNDQHVGKIAKIYVDASTGQPEWALVDLASGESTFAPLSDAQIRGDDLKVPFDKQQVEKAPDVAGARELNEEQEKKLYSHYGYSETSAQKA